MDVHRSGGVLSPLRNDFYEEIKNQSRYLSSVFGKYYSYVTGSSYINFYDKLDEDDRNHYLYIKDIESGSHYLLNEKIEFVEYDGEMSYEEIPSEYIDLYDLHQIIKSHIRDESLDKILKDP